MDELSGVPETQQSQQAAGVEMVVRVEDPLQMYTEQGDIALETQQDSDSSDEDIADTQAAGGGGGGGGGQEVQGQVKDQGRATCIRREG